MRALALAVLALALPAAAQTTTRSASSGAVVGRAAPVVEGALTGIVTDAETGRPVMGAGVVIPALGIGAVSQRDGTYEIAGVPPGLHDVRTGAFRYHLVTVQARVGDAGTLDIALRPGAAVGCEVLHTHHPPGHEPEDGR